ncbi:hypothetical protein O6H91_03G101300 [Diphasiastrum complanatum]|uniref:Uncharacterized protein n=2 Tax=Diphasiastrum complanatum TaxID=34168 RepID=A0ACC2E9E0_DIPCM|nr:hypothetical protein O6H91_03G101300 [Diphasiastrum complanatum]
MNRRGEDRVQENYICPCHTFLAGEMVSIITGVQLPRVISRIFLCLLSSVASHAWMGSSNLRPNSIGVNYGQVANNLPSVQQAVTLVRSTTIGKIKLYDANATILRAFANTNIQVTVGIANDHISSLTNPTSARSWINDNVSPYLPATQITTICVGNEVLTAADQSLLSQLLPAMENLHSALVSSNLQSQVKITTPQSLALLSNSFPPSAGAFNPTIAQSFIKPLLGFLSRTNSSLMVNAYPYFAYRRDPHNISLAYSLFLPNTGVNDPNTGILYSNLFSAQIDAVYSAMAKLNVTDVEVGVSETGWPSVGDPDEVGVSVQNAMTYNQNLIYYIVTNPGTPLRPRRPINTFIFALFNENLKPGPTSERNFGLYQPDGSAVYEVQELAKPSTSPPSNNGSSSGGSGSGAGRYPPPNNGSSSGSNSSSGGSGSAGGYSPSNGSSAGGYAPPNNASSSGRNNSSGGSGSGAGGYPPYNNGSSSGSNSSSGSSGMGAVGGGNQTRIWCVAKPGTDRSLLAGAITYACGVADCSAIQSGGSCFYPNELVSHASYAFNSYYQRHGRNYWNCDFQNNAIVTFTNPSYGGCIYPAN